MHQLNTPSLLVHITLCKKRCCTSTSRSSSRGYFPWLFCQSTSWESILPPKQCLCWGPFLKLPRKLSGEERSQWHNEASAAAHCKGHLSTYPRRSVLLSTITTSFPHSSSPHSPPRLPNMPKIPFCRLSCHLSPDHQQVHMLESMEGEMGGRDIKHEYI